MLQSNVRPQKSDELRAGKPPASNWRLLPSQWKDISFTQTGEAIYGTRCPAIRSGRLHLKGKKYEIARSSGRDSRMPGIAGPIEPGHHEFRRCNGWRRNNRSPRRKQYLRQGRGAQLEAILRAKGSNVRVVNAGINGDTTEGMLGRLDRAVPNGTSAVILQPGGNDGRKGRPDRTADIQSRLAARNIPVIVLGNSMLGGLPHQPDGQHLTPEGYHMLAESLASQVTGAIGR
jgi:acyl-CoA thioesterase-1